MGTRPYAWDGCGVVYVVYRPNGAVDKIFAHRRDAAAYLARKNFGIDEWKTELLYKIGAHVVHDGPLER